MTFNDALAAGVAVSRSSILMNALGAALAASAVAALLVNDWLFGVLFLVGAVAMLSGYAIGLLTAFTTTRRADLMREPVELRADAETIRTVMASMSSEARWSAYKRVRLMGGSLLLELGNGVTMAVPRRVFQPAELDRLLLWADRANVLDRASRARPVVIGAVIGIAITAVLFVVPVLIASR